MAGIFQDWVLLYNIHDKFILLISLYYMISLYYWFGKYLSSLTMLTLLEQTVNIQISIAQVLYVLPVPKLKKNASVQVCANTMYPCWDIWLVQLTCWALPIVNVIGSAHLLGSAHIAHCLILIGYKNVRLAIMNLNESYALWLLHMINCCLLITVAWHPSMRH